MTQERTPYPGYIIEIGEITAGGGFAFIASDQRASRGSSRSASKIIAAACEIAEAPATRSRSPAALGPAPERQAAYRASLPMQP